LKKITKDSFKSKSFFITSAKKEVLPKVGFAHVRFLSQPNEIQFFS